MDQRRLMGAILCLISILTPFNIEEYLAHLCQHKHSVLD